MSRAKKIIEQIDLPDGRIPHKSPEEIARVNNAIHLTGNPPRGGAIIRQYAINPTGQDFFSSEAADIGAAYDELPVLDPKAVDLWRKFGDLCLEQAAILKTKYEVIRYDDIDPYMDSDSMLADIDKGIYKVTSLHSLHPVWNVDTNVAFRIVHDLMGHGVSSAEFSLHGEVLAYQAQCMTTPEELWPVLFTEIVGQVTSLCVHHFFGPQKVGIINLSQEEIDNHVKTILESK